MSLEFQSLERIEGEDSIQEAITITRERCLRSRNSTLLAVVVAFVFSFGIVDRASASVATFGFGGEWAYVGGPSGGVTVGDAFTGTFSYTLGQTGTPLGFLGTGTQYVLDSFSLTTLGQTVSATGGYVNITNDSWPGDRFDLSPRPAAGGIVKGSINGAPASDFLLSLVALNGAPFMDESLPTALNLAAFPDLKRVDVIFLPGNGAVVGQITDVHVVPLPGTVWLFMSGICGLVVWRARHKRTTTTCVEQECLTL